MSKEVLFNGPKSRTWQTELSPSKQQELKEKMQAYFGPDLFNQGYTAVKVFGPATLIEEINGKLQEVVYAPFDRANKWLEKAKNHSSLHEDGFDSLFRTQSAQFEYCYRTGAILPDQSGSNANPELIIHPQGITIFGRINNNPVEKESRSSEENNWFKRLPQEDQEGLKAIRMAQFPELKKGAEIFYQIPSTNKMILFKGDKQEARHVDAWANAQSLITEAQIDDLNNGESCRYEIEPKPILLPPDQWQEIADLKMNHLVIDNNAVTILRKPCQEDEGEPKDDLVTREETTTFIKAIPSIGLNHS